MSEAGGGDCDLLIDPVLPADEAAYQCQVMVLYTCTVLYD